MRLKHLTIITGSCALMLALAACAAPPATTTPVIVTREAPVPVAEATASPVATDRPLPPTDIVIQDLLREDNQGAVSVSVEPLNLDAPGDTLDFEVAMSTHSVDLSMDLMTLATLTTDTGLSATPVVWDAPRGGHHVGGTLSFPVGANGKSLLEGTKKLTLTIRDVDAPERIFIWELAP